MNLDTCLGETFEHNNYLGTHVEECWEQEYLWDTTRGGTTFMRILGQRTTMKEGALG